jgi:hypothetical protein
VNLETIRGEEKFHKGELSREKSGRFLAIQWDRKAALWR